MGNLRGWEWIIILALALLLFGGFKKLPDAARGIGRSLRIFKAETKGLSDSETEPDAATSPPAITPATQAAPSLPPTPAVAPAVQPIPAPQPSTATAPPSFPAPPVPVTADASGTEASKPGPT